MKVIPGNDYLERHLSKVCETLQHGSRPTEEDYAEAGLEILKTFGLSILRNNGMFEGLEISQIKGVKFVALIGVPVIPTKEKISDILHKKFEEKTGLHYDPNKNIIIPIPTNTVGGMLYGVYEIPAIT